jgi:putative transposase
MNNRFKKGQRIAFNEREYIIDERLPNSDVQLRDYMTNSYLSRPLNVMIEELFDGKLMILDETRSYLEKKAANILSIDFTQLPENLRNEAKRRFAYVKEIMMQDIHSKTKGAIEPVIEMVAKEIGDKNPPSYITLYRWWRDYVSSGENIRSLVPLQGSKGNRESKISSEVEKIINDVIEEKYLSKQRISVQSIYNTIYARIEGENKFRDDENKLIIPNQSTIYRRVNKLDSYEVMKARFGKRIADSKFKAIKQGIAPTRPLERVEIDHTKIDLLVIDAETGMPIGRPWLTTAIDVYSKMIFGMYLSFNPPSYLSVMQCLMHGISPKTYIKKRYLNIRHSWDTYGILVP